MNITNTNIFLKAELIQEVLYRTHRKYLYEISLIKNVSNLDYKIIPTSLYKTNIHFKKAHINFTYKNLINTMM